MHTVSRDADIFCQVLGDGPPVVLLHPFPTHHDFWLPVADLLVSRYRLILPDLRGHGESTAGEGPATMEKHAADIARVCDASGVGRAVFIGVSIGGYILFDCWRRYPERVAALVFANTKAGADSDEARRNRLRSADDAEAHGTEPFFQTMVPKLIGETTRATRPDLVDSALRMMRRMTAPALAAVQRGMAERPDSLPTLKTIKVPTLVIAGEEDTLTPRKEQELIQQGIAGSRVEVVPRAGHLAPFEQPAHTGRFLRTFLDSLNIG